VLVDNPRAREWFRYVCGACQIQMGDAQKEKAPLVRRGFKTKGVGGWGWGIAFRSPQQCIGGILCS
jgi:hypothetical protein